MLVEMLGLPESICTENGPFAEPSINGRKSEEV